MRFLFPRTVKDHNTSNGLIPISYFIFFKFPEKGRRRRLTRERENDNQETQRWSNLFLFINFWGKEGKNQLENSSSLNETEVRRRSQTNIKLSSCQLDWIIFRCIGKGFPFFFEISFMDKTSCWFSADPSQRPES